MRRFLLIKASRLDSVRATPDERQHALVPPMGLLYLAAALREAFPRCEVQLLDLGAEPRGLAAIDQALETLRPDLVGISAISIEAPILARAAHRVRSLSPSTTIVAGGPHPSVDPARVLRYGDVDCVAFGEGEATLIELVKALSAGSDPLRVSGLGLWRDGRVVRTDPRQRIEDLDSLPTPAWDLVDFDVYGRAWNMQGYVRNLPYAPIFTSRGCPYTCSYCHNMFGRRFRSRSPDNVMREVELLANTYGVRELHLVDDIFNLHRDRMARICGALARHLPGLAIAFPNGVRSDLLDEEALDTLVAAGTYSMAFAIESGSARVQREIGKRLDIAKAMEAIRLADERGIISHGFFMMGFPTETEADLTATAETAFRSRLLFAHFFKVCPFPGTRLHESLRIAGADLEQDIEHLHFDSPRVNYTAVPDEVLNRIFYDAFKSFYADPERLLRIRQVLSAELFAELFRRLVDYLPEGDDFVARFGERIASDEEDADLTGDAHEFGAPAAGAADVHGDGSQRLHFFEEGGRRILVDGNTMRFFEVDTVSEQWVRRWRTGDRRRVEEELARRFPPADVQRARHEIEGLAGDRLLFGGDPEQRMPVPGFTEISISRVTLWMTAGCNLACSYCWNDRGRGGDFPAGAVLDPGVAGLAIEQALETRADHPVPADQQAEPLTVDLYGGEPLVAPERMWEIIGAVRGAAAKRGESIRLEITTNATLVTREVADRLASEGVGVAVSLDGPAVIHDRHRAYPDGRGSHSATVRGLEHLAAAGVPGLTVRATVAPPYPRVADVVAYLTGLGVPNLEIDVASLPVCAPGGCGAAGAGGHGAGGGGHGAGGGGNGAGGGAAGSGATAGCARIEIDCDGAGDERVRTELARVFVDYAISHQRIIDIRTANRLFYLMNAPHVDIPCGAGRRMLTVTPDGKVYPCLRFAGMRTLCMGEVGGELSTRALIGMDQCYPSGIDECHDCWARYICQRICPAVSVEEGGSVLHQPRRECAAYLRNLELSFWILAELKEKAPDFLASMIDG